MKKWKTAAISQLLLFCDSNFSNISKQASSAPSGGKIKWSQYLSSVFQGSSKKEIMPLQHMQYGKNSVAFKQFQFLQTL